ncbi:MAG: C40 family peptidase [Rhodoferax sp.]|jgi:cell wall-associated NlpC family hydrolase
MELPVPSRFFATVCLCAALQWLGGCSTAPVAHYGNDYSGSADIPSRLTPDQAGDVTIYAIGLVGTPYRYGGNTPQSGFDCSGLIGHVYQTRAHVVPPRTVAKLNGWGNPVAANRIRSGDLVIFAQRGHVTHAGIYVGQGRFVHAPSTGGEVRLDYLGSKYWSAQEVAFRRP